MTDEDYEDSISFSALAVIEFPPNFRERYFKNAYDALKREVDKLSLTEFATDGGKAAFLSQLLDDETELVYFNTSYYTVDEFRPPGDARYAILHRKGQRSHHRLKKKERRHLCRAFQPF